MKTNSWTKFGHNLMVQDEFLSVSNRYEITDGLNRHHQWVSRRIKVFYQSGIALLWEKWERIRFSGERHHSEKLEVKSLSFAESEIHLVFYVLLCCALICV
ncbi:hypothetical protein KN506_19325, partial [Acinetobacter baumannii]|uniref:hypothetical protein n=1 Tax=Acinetobacter baumannii TaxID=470 RepID=UPI001C04BCA7